MQQPRDLDRDTGPAAPSAGIDGANAIQLDPQAFGDSPPESQTAGAYFEQVEQARSTLGNLTDAAAGTDGRTLRRTRNRSAVISALLDLMRAGVIDPTVAEIADLAGVSHRSVFRYFDDLTDLVRAAFDHEVEDAIPLAVIADLGEGPLERRIDSLVDARLRVYGHTYQVGRIARMRSATIPAIDEALKAISSLVRVQVRNHFRQELTALDSTDAAFVVDAMLALVSFEAYDMQLRMLGHSPERIRQVWIRALHSLLRP